MNSVLCTILKLDVLGQKGTAPLPSLDKEVQFFIQKVCKKMTYYTCMCARLEIRCQFNTILTFQISKYPIQFA